MANNFNGQGKPLDDPRLKLSGTTIAGEQQYRMWKDSQQILVPKGQSITKPNSPENVQANVGVHGDITKGYFQAPCVEFRNTNDYKLFDRFCFVISREIPDDPDIEPEDLGFYYLELSLTLVLKFREYLWELPQHISLVRTGVNQYSTTANHHITTYKPYSQQGNVEFNIEFFSSFTYNIAETHKLGNMQMGKGFVYMGLQNMNINRGSTKYLYHPHFNHRIENVLITAKDIKLIKGVT